MILLHDLRWLYFAPPRTASTSIHRWLQEVYGGERFHTGSHQNQAPPHMPLAYWWGFTVVRNPYDRLASWHAASTEHRKKSPVEFMEWLMYGEPLRALNPYATSSQARFIDTSCAARLRGFLVLRWEDLTDCLYDLPFVMPGDLLRLKHLAKTEEKPEWPAAAIDMVAIHSADDFRRFGYEL